MKIAPLIIGILVFSAMSLIVFTQFVPELYGANGYNMLNDINATYLEGVEEYQNTTDLITGIRDTSPGGIDSSIDEEAQTSDWGALNIVLTPISMFTQAPGILKGMVTNISSKIGINNLIVTGTILSIFILLIAIAAINAFLNRGQ